VRVVLLRTGIVLARDGGVLAKMLPIFGLFAGGPLGSGRQWMSWIHREDLVDLM
jgi:NAD dependent epimerase/dehydratase family enzyme